MIQLKKIDGISIDYTSNIELTATGNSTSLSVLKAMLTIKNKSIEAQLSSMKRIVPRSQRHAMAIHAQMEELKAKEIHTAWAENPDGSLSIPPGYWFLGDIKGSSHLGDVSPVFMEDERYYQKEIVSELLKYKRSSVVAATGVGKSRIIRDLVISHRKAGRRVMVCVPSIELLDQTADTVDSGLAFIGDVRCGRLGDGKKPKDGAMVVLSTIQSAINFVDRFEVVIFDELHVIAAESYQAVAAAAISAQYMHGLTATIDRPDGLTPLIHAWCGPTVYSYPYKKAVEDEFLSPIKYYSRMLTSNARVHKNMHSIKEYIAVHSDKTFIDELESIVQKSLAAGRKTLVLFKASECCDALAARLGISAASGAFRKPLDDFKKGKAQLLIGNVALLSTGWDCPQISSIIYVASGTSEIVFMQSIGRGTRICEGKKDCVVIDVSADHGKYINQGKVRKRIAEMAGYEILT